MEIISPRHPHSSKENEQNIDACSSFLALCPSEELFMIYILVFIKTPSVRQIQMQRQHGKQTSALQLCLETCKLGVRTSASEDTRKAKLLRLQPDNLIFDLSCL